MLSGCIDALHSGGIRGWVREDDRPDAPVALLVTSGSRMLGRSVANRFRPDLLAAGIGHGRFAFEVPFAPPLTPSRSWLVHIRSEATGEDIPGSPVRLPAKGEFDAAFRRTCVALLDAFGSDGELDERIAFLSGERDRLMQRRVERRVLSQVGGRRALVIDVRMPRPDHDGGSTAIMSHMRSLRRLGFDVSFAAQAADGDGSVLDAVGITSLAAPWCSSVEEALRRTAHGFDLVYLHRLPVAVAYMALVRQLQSRARVVYGLADLHHLRLARQAAFEDRPELMEEARRVRDVELWCAGQADAVITHSTAEADLLRTVVEPGKVHVVSWSMPIRAGTRPFGERAGVALVGHFAHRPNSAAAAILCEEIVPALQRDAPVIECVLAGDDLPEMLRTPRPGLRYLGHVPDLGALFDSVRVTVAPVPFGAGVKGKVLASFAAGVPCVCSPVAAEGIDLPQSLQCLVAADTEAAVRLIVRLHTDEAFHAMLSRRCLAFAEQACSEGLLDRRLDQAVGGQSRLTRIDAV